MLPRSHRKLPVGLVCSCCGEHSTSREVVLRWALYSRNEQPGGARVACAARLPCARGQDTAASLRALERAGGWLCLSPSLGEKGAQGCQEVRGQQAAVRWGCSWGSLVRGEVTSEEKGQGVLFN